MAALEAWLREADPEIRTVGRGQLNLVMSVGRHLGGREAYLRYLPSRYFEGDIPIFSDFPLEKQVAEVRMSINGQRVKCQIWAVEGHIAILEFSKLPPLFLRKAHVEVLGVKTGPFASDRKRNELAASLPPDYVEFVREAGPVEPEAVDGIGPLALDQVYVATIDGEQYWMLAEVRDIGMLGVRTEGDDRQVYMLSYEGRPAVALSESFRDAMTKARSLA